MASQFPTGRGRSVCAGAQGIPTIRIFPCRYVITHLCVPVSSHPSNPTALESKIFNGEQHSRSPPLTSTSSWPSTPCMAGVRMVPALKARTCHEVPVQSPEYRSGCGIVLWGWEGGWGGDARRRAGWPAVRRDANAHQFPSTRARNLPRAPRRVAASCGRMWLCG